MDYVHVGQAGLKVSRPVLGIMNFDELTEEPASSDGYLRDVTLQQLPTASNDAPSRPAAAPIAARPIARTHPL